MTYEANVSIETHLCVCSLQSKMNWQQALISPYKTKDVMIALCRKKTQKNNIFSTYICHSSG